MFFTLSWRWIFCLQGNYSYFVRINIGKFMSLRKYLGKWRPCVLSCAHKSESSINFRGLKKITLKWKLQTLVWDKAQVSRLGPHTPAKSFESHPLPPGSWPSFVEYYSVSYQTNVFTFLTHVVIIWTRSKKIYIGVDILLSIWCDMMIYKTVHVQVWNARNQSTSGLLKSRLGAILIPDVM